MAKAFKVSVLYEDGNEVPPYDLIVPEGSMFTSNTDYAGANARIRVPSSLSNQLFYVADTVDELQEQANGTGESDGSKTYYALLSQSATANPTPYLMNSGNGDFLGDIVWTRTGSATFRGTLAGAFVPFGTFVFPIALNDETVASTEANTSTDYIEINTGADSKLTFTPICIKVFTNITPP